MKARLIKQPNSAPPEQAPELSKSQRRKLAKARREAEELRRGGPAVDPRQVFAALFSKNNRAGEC